MQYSYGGAMVHRVQIHLKNSYAYGKVSQKMTNLVIHDFNVDIISNQKMSLNFGE